MIPHGAHLVGSVPLSDSETVFRTVASVLGSHLEQLPDGETGIRKDWIAWQYQVLASTPGLEPVPVGDRGYLRRQLVHLTRERAEPLFGSLGYADAALASFPIFDRLQRSGAIPAGLRFQVSLPTPLAPMTVFVELADRARVEPAYERQLLAELHRILDGIPHDRLSIQWDVAAEFGHLEGFWPTHFENMEQGILDRLRRLGTAVPNDVALGYHLCYGDFGHRHFMELPNASKLVATANALARLERRISWIHMPVALGWSEPAPFAHLAQLNLQPTTHLYLGLIHAADGLEGARRRLALASQFVPKFGIATECGWGRRPPGTIPSLLDLHAKLLRPPESSSVGIPAPDDPDRTCP